MKILILSPHPDDAAFSCSDHINYWKKNNHTVTIFSIFSKYEANNISNDTKKFMNMSGCKNSKSFERQRKSEDLCFFQQVDTNYLFGDYTDGAFREYRKQPIYPTYNSLFSKKISKKDKQCITRITNAILSQKKKFDYFVIPLGVGCHVDHLIANLSTMDAVAQDRILYYVDVPYYFKIRNWSKKYLQLFLSLHKSVKWITPDKIVALNCYSSQISLILKNNKTFFFNIKRMIFPEIILLPDNTKFLFR